MANQQGKVAVAQIAWLAGFWDGEGTITLKQKPTTMSPLCGLVNTDQGTMQRVQQLLKTMGVGSHVRERQPSKKSQRAAYVIEITGLQRCEPLLTQMLPYLVTKAKQAKIVLQFIHRRKSTGPRSPYRTQDWDALAEVRKLNATTLRDYTRGTGAFPARECRHCGASYLPKQLGQAYCSVRCRHAQFLQPPPKRPCERCGEQFQPLPKRGFEQRFCSARCRGAAAQKRHRERKAQAMV